MIIYVTFKNIHSLTDCYFDLKVLLISIWISEIISNNLTVGQLCLFCCRFSHRYWLIKTLQKALTYQILASLSFFILSVCNISKLQKSSAIRNFTFFNMSRASWWNKLYPAIYVFAINYIPKLETLWDDSQKMHIRCVIQMFDIF